MLLIIGLIIGLVLGLTGAGGSIFAVPLLMLLAGIPMTDAIGISLGAVAASTLYGSARNLIQTLNRQETLDVGQKTIAPLLWQPGVILAATGAMTAPVGKWLGLHTPELWLVSGFSLLAAVIALRMWLSASKNPAAAQIVRAGNFAQTPSSKLLCNLSPSGQFELRPRCITGLLIGGLTVGLLSGLLGVGGGFLIVPLLLALSAVSMMQAVSTSLVIIALVSSSGFISHLFMTDHNDWQLLGLVAGGGVIGMMIGQAVSHKIANTLLQKIFAVSLLVVALITFSAALTPS